MKIKMLSSYPIAVFLSLFPTSCFSEGLRCLSFHVFFVFLRVLRGKFSLFLGCGRSQRYDLRRSFASDTDSTGGRIHRARYPDRPGRSWLGL